MALANVNESDEDYQSMSDRGADDHVTNPELDDLPPHPVVSLQGAFEESILESLQEDDDVSTSPIDSNAERRRKKLLESPEYRDSWNSRWRQRPTARFHPLLKLMSQIVFGMHLLEQQQAKSDDEVIRILQTHVGEIDTFLQQTAEDFDLAIKDIEERIRFLKLPMEHVEVFEVMLEEKKFRTQLLEANDKIQAVMDRTTKAMEGARLDISKTLEATKELGRYLDAVEPAWPRDRRGMLEVVELMRGNEQGWKRYLKDLQSTGNTLGSRMVQLSAQMREMSKMASQAARRSKKNSRSVSEGIRSAPASPGLRSKFAQDFPPPPLPTDSRMASPTVSKASLHEAPDAVSDARHTSRLPMGSNPRSQSPAASSSRSAHSVKLPARPRTSDSKAHRPRDARIEDTRQATSDLADFFRQPSSHLNPLRSNPPDTRRLVRSQSDGVGNIISGVSSRHNHQFSSVSMPRSTSQGHCHQPSSASLGSAPSCLQTSHMSKTSAPGLSAIPEKKDQIQTMPSNGFTRRISKRMKHIQPAPTISPPIPAPAALPFAHRRPTSPAVEQNPPNTITSKSTSRPPAVQTPSASTLSTASSVHDREEAPIETKKPAAPLPPLSAVAPPAAAPTGTGTTIASRRVATHSALSPPLPPLPPSPSAIPGQLRSGAPTSISVVQNNHFAAKPQPVGTAASITETTASRRYRSLRKIFHRSGIEGPRMVA